MRSITITHGPYAVVYGTGTIFRHIPSRREVHFQPGDDQDYFLGELENLENVYPGRSRIKILSDLWQEFEPTAQSMDANPSNPIRNT